MARTDWAAPGADTIDQITTGRAALSPVPAKKESVEEIDLDKLDDNPDQPREWMDPELLEELATSIVDRGTRQPDQPIIVRRSAGDRYFIVMGHRRKAAKLRLRDRATATERNLWSTISAIVRDVDDEKSAFMALDENIKRADLTPVEEGAGYALLLARYAATVPTKKALAQRLGIDEQRVQRMIRLYEGPEFLKVAILRGVLVPAPGQADRAKAASTDVAPKRRQARRRLEFKPAMEFLRLYEQLAKQGPRSPVKCEQKAAERTGFWIQRTLEEGWSLRRIEEHCAGAARGKAAAPSPAAPSPIAAKPAYESSSERFVVHLARCRQLGQAERADVRTALLAAFDKLSESSTFNGAGASVPGDGSATPGAT